mgnify:CR=1 FL=1
MKKNYFMLALASMMMAACANNDLVDEGVVKEEVPQAIGFETFSNKISRQVADATKLDSYHDAFGVWAYKTVGTEKTVMENYGYDVIDLGKDVAFDKIKVAIDPSRIHIFDKDTEKCICH